MEAGAGGPGEFLGGDHLAVGADGVEGVHRVDREQHAVPEVAPHAGRGLVAHVGLDTDDDDLPDPALAQPLVQIRLSIEGGVDGLGDEKVGRLRPQGLPHKTLQFVARHTGRQGRTRRRILPHDHDRPPLCAPVPDQRGDVLLGGRVVPTAEIGVLETHLHVDDDEGGVLLDLDLAHDDKLRRAGVHARVAEMSSCDTFLPCAPWRPSSTTTCAPSTTRSSPKSGAWTVRTAGCPPSSCAAARRTAGPYGCTPARWSRRRTGWTAWPARTWSWHPAGRTPSPRCPAR